MYVIITNNINLKNYIEKLGATSFMIPNSISNVRYKNDGVLTTLNRGVAIIALVDGARVYETVTIQGLFLEDMSKEKLVNKVIDELFETIGIRKNMKGYEFLKYMLKKYVEDDSYCINRVCNVVYPECATEFGVAPGTVARKVTELIKYSYERNTLKYKVLFAHTGISTLKTAPKPGEFLPVIGGKIRNLIF